jgi:hypothetical protein
VSGKHCWPGRLFERREGACPNLERIGRHLSPGVVQRPYSFAAASICIGLGPSPHVVVQQHVPTVVSRKIGGHQGGKIRRACSNQVLPLLRPRTKSLRLQRICCPTRGRFRDAILFLPFHGAWVMAFPTFFLLYVFRKYNFFILKRS